MSHRHTARVVSDEDLLYEAALKRRCLWRIIGSFLLCLIGLLAIAFSTYPLVLKSTIPLMWINEANVNGWTDQLQSVGVHLLAKGRIEAYPLWVSVLSSSMGCIFLWAGGTLFRLRYESSIWETLGSRQFWTQAYLWSPPNDVISIRKSVKNFRKT